MKPLRRRKPAKTQLDILRSLQAKFPEVAHQLQPAIDRGGFHECLLCGDPVAWLGAFLPDDHKAWGAPPGKWRTWFYGLCEACFHRPGVQVRVEAVILADIRMGKARWN